VVLDLNGVVTNMDKMLCRLIGEDIDLISILDPGLERVKADPGAIEQVLLNLAVNSRDAMPRGGKLTIETRNVELDPAYLHGHVEIPAGHYVLLAVSDTGCGMDDSIRNRIFEPFFTTKEVGKGTGLGLAMVYGIIKQSGGHIEVYSEVGLGTTFKIYLPRHKDSARSAESALAAPEGMVGSECILVVEDEEIVRELAREVLRGCGYTVLVARQGLEALRVCEEYIGTIHLVMTDVVMPEMSGRELVQRLALLRPGVKLLYMSGYTDEALQRQGVHGEGITLLHKPFTPGALARQVREVLDRV
jgi:CheY-like chemotaxis protein